MENSGRFGFVGLMALLFIALKLTGYVAWSWWWVLAPVWAPFALILGIVAVAAVIAAMADSW